MENVSDLYNFIVNKIPEDLDLPENRDSISKMLDILRNVMLKTEYTFTDKIIIQWFVEKRIL